MWTDVVDLREFYDSHLGQLARRMIRRRIRLMWPSVAGESLLGLGYATPFIRSYCGQAERVLAAMPAQQGVQHWPADKPGCVALVHENRLPFPDLSFDRVLMVHALECSEALRPMLREAWRVLSDSGRLLVVVPNRRGLWARFERTPFGFGHPYSASQLSRLLRDNMFAPLRTEAALYVPPIRWHMLHRTAPAWERIGARWFPMIAGVTLIEAGKEIYPVDPIRTGRRARIAPAIANGAHPTNREPASRENAGRTHEA